MNQVVPSRITTEERSKASAVSLSSSGSSSFLKVESLGDVVRFAEMMCQSKAGIPSYLHGAAADCMAITMQALQWGMNPFSVAQKSYKIKDVIAYEAQLIAAVINTRADLKRRPQISFEGEGDARQCTVVFEFNDVATQIYVSPPVSKITPKNSPLWKTDPDQQLSYYSIRAGGRRYCPEVILGVYDRDEVEEFRGPDGARDVTPRPTVMERLRASQNNAPDQPASEQEGSSASSVQQQTDRVLTGDILDNDKASEARAADGASVDDGEPHAEASATPSNGEPSGKDIPVSNDPDGKPVEPSSFRFPPEEFQHLKDFARKALKEAGRADAEKLIKIKNLDGMLLNYRDVIETDDGIEALNGIVPSVHSVVKREITKAASADYIARDILSCSPDELMGAGNG